MADKIQISAYGSGFSEDTDDLNKLPAEDRPLRVGVVNGELVIRIGVSTLAWAADHQDDWNPYDEEKRDFRQAYKVGNPEAFANDVRIHLLDEREDGSTPLADLLDRMANAVLENGDLSVDDCPPGTPSVFEQDLKQEGNVIKTGMIGHVVPCPAKTKKFLWWTWEVDTHRWHVIQEWKTPLSYGTCFWTKKKCLKCGLGVVDSYESYGP